MSLSPRSTTIAAIVNNPGQRQLIVPPKTLSLCCLLSVGDRGRVAMGAGSSVVRQTYLIGTLRLRRQSTMFLRPYVGSEATFRVAFETYFAETRTSLWHFGEAHLCCKGFSHASRRSSLAAVNHGRCSSGVGVFGSNRKKSALGELPRGSFALLPAAAPPARQGFLCIAATRL